MSIALNRGLLSGSIDASLEEIEAVSTSSCPLQGDVKIGPFAVLDFTSPSDEPRSSSFASNATDRTTEQSRPDASNRLPLTQQPFASEEFLGLPDDSLQWSDIFGLNDNLYGITSNFSFDSMNYPSFPASSRWLVSESEMYNASLAMNLDLTHNMVHEERQAHCISIPQTTLDSPVASLDILNDASFLLKVFQKHVISQLTIVPLGKKGPWKLLNLPAAIITLADLTVMESQDVSRARQANLFSLISCSAMYLSITPSAGYGDSISITHWQQVANQAYLEAQHHMRISLSEETEGPTKAKYKDQLMAICAMIESAVSNSHALVSSETTKINL